MEFQIGYCNKENKWIVCGYKYFLGLFKYEIKLTRPLHYIEACKVREYLEEKQ